MTKFFDTTAQYKSIEKSIDSAAKRVFKSGIFIGGEEVRKFENEFAKFCGVKYAISVNSGTDALFLSLKALGIGKGDEVITTPFTFIATAGTIANTGAGPVFADIESDTFNINPELVEGLITPRTKAIMPVHLFGQMADMTAIMRIAKKYKLFVIEDAAQAVGARMAGSVGDLGCFSFFPAKNIGAYGDGGMITTNNKKLAEKLRLLKNHGSSPKDKYRNLIVGTNSRLDSLQAAILRVKLKHLRKWNKARAEKAKYYNNALKNIDGLITPAITPNGSHVFHQYTLQLPSTSLRTSRSGQARNALKKHLEKQGIPTMVYYPLPLHLQPALKYLGYKKGDFPEAERAANEVLSLPIYPEITEKEQGKIVETIKNFYAK
ncbi:MAG: Cell wall biogenesis regulatory protein [Parcubacteria group bacterium GW2011_GWB1_45_9]|nr:MAG: Cell wall biogenesis regulatory protein [Parcubacteria group bacterium GW2011_GWB1_45_9]